MPLSESIRTVRTAPSRSTWTIFTGRKPSALAHHRVVSRLLSVALAPDDVGVERTERGLDPLLSDTGQNVLLEATPAIGHRVLDATFAPHQIPHQRKQVD